jgi:hypothetical protein
MNRNHNLQALLQELFHNNTGNILKWTFHFVQARDAMKICCQECSKICCLLTIRKHNQLNAPHTLLRALIPFSLFLLIYSSHRNPCSHLLPSYHRARSHHFIHSTKKPKSKCITTPPSSHSAPSYLLSTQDQQLLQAT